jgi:hypothetical protein
VTASDDLRPCVLEAARAERGLLRGRRRVRQVAVGVAVLGAFLLSADRGLDTDHGTSRALGYADAAWVFARAEAYASDDSDIGWGLVEAFTELRRRQSEAIRMTQRVGPLTPGTV